MRLIDADELLKQIPAVKNWDEKVSLLGATADFICMICDAPTIEAKPVVHAHWEKANPEKGVEASAMCSNCKVYAGYWDATMEEFAYCPYCGAQMDGEGE